MRSTAQDREAAAADGRRHQPDDRHDLLHRCGARRRGGVVYGLYFGSIQFNLGFYVGLKAFTAAVLGGIGNTTGPRSAAS